MSYSRCLQSLVAKQMRFEKLNQELKREEESRFMSHQDLDCPFQADLEPTPVDEIRDEIEESWKRTDKLSEEVHQLEQEISKTTSQCQKYKISDVVYFLPHQGCARK